MAAAPDLPEYVYAYINTRKGPAPEEALNPPFFVEKDRVNFFIIPTSGKTKESYSEIKNGQCSDPIRFPKTTVNSIKSQK